MNSLKLGLYIINDFLDLQKISNTYKIPIQTANFKIIQIVTEIKGLFEYSAKQKEI